MNRRPDGGQDEHGVNSGRRPLQLLVLAGIVGLECLLLAAAAIFLLVELFVEVPVSYGSAIALLAIALLAAVWLALLFVHLLRGAPWTRAGIVVWQLLQIAVAIGLFQGVSARPDLAWALLLPSAVAIALAFSKPVIWATARTA